MKKVITYGTYDLLHHGHIRLLERAKKLGDYLIVGITADAFDRSRGKINTRQSLMERMEAVRATGIADEIIVEEYEGQKIDDIKRYDVDIFTVGSDWVGKFDYLNEYCEVVYLERTEGISSSEIRTQRGGFRLGVVGESEVLLKYIRESKHVNGLTISGVYTANTRFAQRKESKNLRLFQDYSALLEESDLVYIVSHPRYHQEQVKEALLSGKHVLCESPIALSEEACQELFSLAKQKKLILMEAIKTAYAIAFSRLVLLLKSGKIGEVISVDATCTSLSDLNTSARDADTWNSICAWGPTALLPIFQILGTDYQKMNMYTWIVDQTNNFDAFTKIDFKYTHAVASVKVGKGVKSEGDLVVSGTKGYLYVPSPWWKTDYFEIRYENPANNQRYFFQLDGEGIRNELVSFMKSVEAQCDYSAISPILSAAIAKVMNKFEEKEASTLYFEKT